LILVLTAGFGDGHNTAARSVAKAMEELSPNEEVIVSDFITEVHPCLASLSKSLYQFSIINWPSSWRWVYSQMANVKPGDSPPAWQLMMLKSLEKYLVTKRPRLIISTYPLYAELLSRIKSKIEVPPLVTVITDSISVHPVWLNAPSDLICVADLETQNVVERFGISRKSIRVTGFPVDLAFMKPPAGVEAVKAQRILYLPSTSLRWFSLTLESLRPLLNSGVHLTLPVGKHASRLHHAIQKFMDSIPEAKIEIIGWTNRMPELLQTHDVLISKAGGAILHEVLAARCPVVIDYVVPGQEEGNANMLLNNGCAVRSHSPAETGLAVAQLLAEGGRLGNKLRENMLSLSMPDAALRAASYGLEIARPKNGHSI
jgi:processive 1,2-diacylglycerol beta-glucosyltransferase